MVQLTLLLHLTAAAVLPQTWGRRSAVGSACAAAASSCARPVNAALPAPLSFPLPASAQASTMDLREGLAEGLAAASPSQEAIFKRLPNPPRPPTPPAALLLRAEEVCHDQEELLRSALESERFDPSLILARRQTPLFVRILIRNTNLEQISGAQGAAAALRGVAAIAEAGLGPLTSAELLAMAQQYRAAQARMPIEHDTRRRSQPTHRIHLTHPPHSATHLATRLSNPRTRSLDHRMIYEASSRTCPSASRRRGARSRGSSGSKTTSGARRRCARPRRLRGRRLSVSAGCIE